MSGAARNMSWMILALAGLAATPAAAQDAAPMMGPAPVMIDSTLAVTGDSVEAALMLPTVSPTAAVLMTPVFPGWGQMAADNGWRAVAVFAYDMFVMSRAVMNERKALRSRRRLEPLEAALFNDYYHDPANSQTVYVKEHYELMRDNYWYAGGALLIAALDAYVGAHLQNFDRDEAPVPEGWDPGDVPQPVELPTASPPGVVLMSWSRSF